MAEMTVTYLEDGEYLHIATNAMRDGDMISIRSDASSDVAMTPGENPEEFAWDMYNLSADRGWTRDISSRGDFEITVPENDRLSDWQLELNGLPRIYDALRFDVIEDFVR